MKEKADVTKGEAGSGKPPKADTDPAAGADTNILTEELEERHTGDGKDSAAGSVRSQAVLGSAARPSVPAKVSPVCPFFQLDICALGDKCEYRHVREEETCN
ncbi:uncharacterized protein BDZ99DRAFT_463499 [Mytilinidion resinicola]|uniref:C3H1-type domain-containing protein n=1 Tax=Mytilinidion resinicola TaxID=574789 RepID=A0A6A6YMG6_9PEZI|nr:uncharacterized protein BDZ99DRAFT_463499 [Mytilinidion resinicola]KAF2809738.1 hypothetical protein BDZ99DRAFT_463499 [Mytilinidion resinicola]